jgi:tripartite-type tricarboxylate transporter receptor subunit TctC
MLRCCGSRTEVQSPNRDHCLASISTSWQSLALLIGLGIGSGIALPQSSFAQTEQGTYPLKPIVLTVGHARQVARQLTESLGKQVVIVNRDGAAGSIAAAAVAKAKPDGYTLLWGTTGVLTITPAYESHVPYDPVRDFAPVSVYGYMPYVVVLHPSVPAKDLKQLIALGRANPGKLTFGSTGVGGMFHLASEVIKSMAGINMVHVPYRGTPSLVTDFLGGQIDLAIMPMSLVAQHIQSGKMRAIGVTGSKRIAQIPDVPTMSEAGLPGYQFTAWWGILAPAGTPNNIISILYTAFSKALDDPKIKALLAQEGGYPGGNTPQEFASLIREELNKYTKLIRDAGLRNTY